MPQRAWPIIAITSIAASMSSMDLTLMFVAYPEIRADFAHLPNSQVSWVLTSFSIVAAALLIPAGRFADRVGRKRVFLTSIVVFSIGSLCVSLAPTVPLIIASRVFQACGGAMLTPSSLAIIMSAIAPERRAMAVGAWSAISGVVTSAAPTLGSLAIHLGSWRLAFGIVVPIGLLCFLVARRVLSESVDPNAGPLPDPFGSMLIFVAVAALAFGIVQSDDWGITDPRPLIGFTIAVLAGAWFFSRCRTQAVPVIGFAIFRTGSFRANAVAALTIGMSFWGVYYVLVAFVTKGWGYDILKAGLLLTPMTAISTITSVKGGNLMDRHGHRAVLAPAAGCLSIGAAIFYAFATDEPNIVGVWLPATLFIGVTSALYFIGVNSAAARLAPAEHLGVVAGVIQTLIRIGGSTGAALGVTLVGDIEAGAGVDGFDKAWLALILAGAVCILAALPLSTKARFETVLR